MQDRSNWVQRNYDHLQDHSEKISLFISETKSVQKGLP